MKVLVLGLDKNILDKESDVAKRARAYANLLDKYFVVVSGDNKNIKLAPNAEALGIQASSKFQTLFQIYRYLDQHLKNNKYDLVTIQDVYYLASIGINLANKYGIKTEIQVHGFEKQSFFRKMIANNNLKQADKIRVVSQRLKNQVVREFGILEEKIYIVPVAINKKKVLDVKSDHKLKEAYPGDFIFLTISRLVPVKNIAMQIKALAKLDKPARLIVVGEGPEKQKLINLGQELKVSERVNFVGWSDDLAGYYRKADCFLLSSNSEGYSMVVAEAVLSGLPVIMTDVGVAGELVKDGRNGLVVPVGDIDALAEAMNKVICNRGLLQQFSSEAKDRHNNILDQSELVDLVIKHWEEIL